MMIVNLKGTIHYRLTFQFIKLSNYFKLFFLNCLFIPCLFFLAGCSREIQPEVVFEINESEYNLSLGNYLSFLEDKEDIISINTIISNKFIYENKFEKIKDYIPNFGYSDSTFWFKLKLKKNNQERKNYFLYIKNSNIDTIEIYEFYSNSQKDNLKVIKQGDQFPISNRQYFNRFFLISPEINNVQEEIIYFKIKSTNSLYFPIFFIDENTLEKEIIKSELAYGIFYGFLIAIFFYNLIVFFTTRDITFFYFIVYIFGFGVLQGIEHGHAFLFLWPKNPDWQKISFIIFLSMSISFGSLFAKSYLKTSFHSPILNKYLLGISYIGIILIFLSFLIDGRKLNLFAIALALVTLVSIFVIAILVFRKKFEPSKYFLIAWTFFMIGSILIFMKYLGVYNYEILIPYSLETASSFQIVLLSYALTAKVNIIKRENQEAIKRTILFQEQANAELEQKVKQRTTELNKYLSSIEKDLIMARNIQENILPKNLDKCINFKFVTHYNPLDKVGGDFFDLYQMNPFKIRVLIADATGHGIQAAMVTMTIKSEYDSLKTFLSDPGELMEELHKRFIEIYKNMKIYFTAFIVDLDIHSQELVYASAGHPAQYLLQDGKIIELPRTGYIIGMLTAKQCTTKKHKFSREDKLFLFTDGLYEEFNNNNQQFGEERLRNIVEENISLSISDIQSICLNSLHDYLENSSQQDDITMIGIEVKPFEK